MSATHALARMTLAPKFGPSPEKSRFGNAGDLSDDLMDMFTVSNFLVA